MGSRLDAECLGLGQVCRASAGSSWDVLGCPGRHMDASCACLRPRGPLWNTIGPLGRVIAGDQRPRAAASRPDQTVGEAIPDQAWRVIQATQVAQATLAMPNHRFHACAGVLRRGGTVLIGFVSSSQLNSVYSVQSNTKYLHARQGTTMASAAGMVFPWRAPAVRTRPQTAIGPQLHT